MFYNVERSFPATLPFMFGVCFRRSGNVCLAPFQNISGTPKKNAPSTKTKTKMNNYKALRTNTQRCITSLVVEYKEGVEMRKLNEDEVQKIRKCAHSFERKLYNEFLKGDDDVASYKTRVEKKKEFLRDKISYYSAVSLMCKVYAITLEMHLRNAEKMLSTAVDKKKEKLTIMIHKMKTIMHYLLNPKAMHPHRMKAVQVMKRTLDSMMKHTKNK